MPNNAQPKIGRDGDMHILLGKEVDDFFTKGLGLIHYQGSRGAYGREAIVRAMVADLITHRREVSDALSILSFKESMELFPELKAEIGLRVLPPPP